MKYDGLWESGNELNAIDGKATSSAFVVFNEEKSKLELFLPGENSTTIMLLLKDGNYGSANYNYNVKNSTLTIDGVAKYQTTK